MDTIQRNRLLLEAEGFDCSQQASALAEQLSNSPLYKVTLDRLSKASAESGLGEISAAYSRCRDLSFNVSSMSEYTRLETEILSLAVKALPRYWINPLNTIDDTEGLNSVGQLFALEDGSLTVDEVLTATDMSYPDKAKILSERVDTWHRRMGEKASRSLEGFRNTKNFSKYGGRGLSFYLRLIVLICANIFLFLILMIPSEDVIQAYYHPTWDSLESYLVYLPLISVGLYDIMYLVYGSITLRRNAGSDYASKFASLQSKDYIERINSGAKELLKALLACAEKGQSFPNNTLYKYAAGFNEELDLEALREEQSKREKHPLSFLRALFLFSCYLAFFSVIFAIVTLILLSQRGLFA